MALGQADLDALVKLYAQGAKVVHLSDGRSHELHSIDDYRKLKRDIEQDIAEDAGTTVNRLVKVGHASGVQ